MSMLMNLLNEISFEIEIKIKWAKLLFLLLAYFFFFFFFFFFLRM